jgi:hypothetical protein
LISQRGARSFTGPTAYQWFAKYLFKSKALTFFQFSKSLSG